MFEQESYNSPDVAQGPCQVVEYLGNLMRNWLLEQWDTPGQGMRKGAATMLPGNPYEKEYMRSMWELSLLLNPTSKLTEKQLLIQRSNIHKCRLLS